MKNTDSLLFDCKETGIEKRNRETKQVRAEPQEIYKDSECKHLECGKVHTSKKSEIKAHREVKSRLNSKVLAMI